MLHRLSSEAICQTAVLHIIKTPETIVSPQDLTNKPVEYVS